MVSPLSGSLPVPVNEQVRSVQLAPVIDAVGGLLTGVPGFGAMKTSLAAQPEAETCVGLPPMAPVVVLNVRRDSWPEVFDVYRKPPLMNMPLTDEKPLVAAVVALASTMPLSTEKPR